MQLKHHIIMYVSLWYSLDKDRTLTHTCIVIQCPERKVLNARFRLLENLPVWTYAGTLAFLELEASLAMGKAATLPAVYLLGFSTSSSCFPYIRWTHSSQVNPEYSPMFVLVAPSKSQHTANIGRTRLGQVRNQHFSTDTRIDILTCTPGTFQHRIPGGFKMDAAIQVDPDVERHAHTLNVLLAPLVDDVLNETWDLVNGGSTMSKDADLAAKTGQFSAHLAEISLRINDIKTKLDTERNLQDWIRPVCKGLRDQSDFLMTWLASSDRADAFEDACLSGNLGSAILVDLQNKAVRRCCRSLACDELMCRFHLLISIERIDAYISQYLEAVLKLMALYNSVTSGRLDLLGHQQQRLNALISEAVTVLRGT